MEIVFANKVSDQIIDSSITGFYGDINDLIKLGIDIEGIVYDDNWTVKRFLNGFKLKINPRIYSIFNYIDLDKSYLNVKIKDLSKTIFKYVLLAYLLINNKKVLIFDHFEIGLTYKEQKKLIKIIRNLKKDGKIIILVSKDLVFMDKIVESICVIKNKEIAFNGKMGELIKKDVISEPEILKFIKLANKNGANLDYTLDSKELLKDIYRGVY